MQVLQQDSRGATVSLTQEDLRIINNALNETCEFIAEWEFATRVGAQRDEALALLEQVNKLLRR